MSPAGSSTRYLCLARGGLRVGDQLSRIYDLPLAILATSSYREAAGTEQGDLDIAQYITMTRGDLAGNVLLVDDLVDSGVTLARVQEHLKDRYPGDHVGALGGAVVQGLLEGEARLPRPVPRNESVDPPAVRGVGHGASAQSRRMDQARHAERSRLISSSNKPGSTPFAHASGMAERRFHWDVE